MKSLRIVLDEAQRNKVAVGHFNVSDFSILRAVVEAGREVNVPVIIGLSEGERQFLGVRHVVALVRSLREESGLPIFLNADHTHSIASAIEAAKAGFDSIVFDLSSLPREDNIRQTKAAVETLKTINPAILIEGEIGDIGTGSQIHEVAPDLVGGLTTPEEAKEFVSASGVDILAPAVGNMHGMLPSMIHGNTRKRLNLARIAEIKQATGSYLTLHGASGTADTDLLESVSAGITVIHINTELRVAWRQSLEKALADNPKEVVPYKLLPPVIAAVKSVAIERLKLFNNLQ
jgi:fructose-bisphosphate aldolase class II